MKTDILIIGGGPAGVVAAVTARKNNPKRRIILIRKNKKSVIPCGIPYIFNRLDSAEKDVMPDKSLEMNKVELLIGEVEKLKPESKTVIFGNKEIKYEKLIIATGSKSVSIPIKGIEKNEVWHIEKDLEYMKGLRKAVLKSKNIVIIGGGFIGVEMAEELSKNKNVSIVEREEHCLITTFDEEFSLLAEERLKEKKVKIFTQSSVKEICGEKKVEFVKLDNGKKIPADLVIVSIGARPNADLAREAGIKIGKYGAIKVNKFMETNKKDVFAVGDCAETRSLLTGECVPVMLASTACHEARIAGANLYKINKRIENKGTLAVFSTSINGLAIGIAGLNEKSAKEDVVVGMAEALNRHPGSLPGSAKIKVKLAFSKSSKRLVGGQVAGPECAAEIINIIALAIQKGINVYDFDVLQIATHPLLTAAPTVYPLITAAQSVLTKIK